MTRAVIVRDGRRTMLTAHGHATGSPAACAAVSSLLYALAGYLINADDVDLTVCELESGGAEIIAEGGKEAFDMAAVGLLQLAKQYPEYVQVVQNI